MVMVKTNKNPVRTIPMGPLGDIRTTNMMVNGKRMAEKFSVFPTFHKYGYDPASLLGLVAIAPMVRGCMEL